MLLTALTHLNLLRPIIPTAALVSVSPTLFLVHTSWRVVSILLPKNMFYPVEDAMWGWYQKFIVFVFESCTGVEVILEGEIPKQKENVLMICNHQTTMDWIVTDFIACRQNMLGHMRFVFKNVLKYFPLYGYVWGVHGGIFVKRDGTYNALKMKKTLNMLMDRKVPLYLVIYPEGTRFCPGKQSLLEKSQNYALQNKLEPFSHVLTPRIKAFHCAVSTLGNYLDAVYDATIIYKAKDECSVRRLAPSMWEVLGGKCSKIFIRFDRIPASEIPIVTNTEIPTFKWLHMRFKLKDTLLGKYYNSGTDNNNSREDVFKSGVVSKSEGMLTATASLAAITAILLGTQTGRMIYVVSAVGGSLFGILYTHAFC